MHFSQCRNRFSFSICHWQVRDVRIITDNKTRRSKGIAYIEFKDTESVPLALGLTGQRLLSVPILVQVSQAEKNRQVQAAAAGTKGRNWSDETLCWFSSLQHYRRNAPRNL